MSAAPGSNGDGRAILLVEDHPAVRTGISLVLERAGFRIAGATASLTQARALAARRRPEAVIVDIALEDGCGIELADGLLTDDPRLGVLFYTGLTDTVTLSRAREVGVRGFVLKAARPEELVRAVCAVADGGEHIDPRLEDLLGAPRILTPRERTVLTRLADGLTGEQIAAELHLSPETVRTHIRNGMEKLGARTRAHAIAIALARGEIRGRSRPRRPFR